MFMTGVLCTVYGAQVYLFSIFNKFKTMIQFTVLAMWFDASYLRIYTTLDFVTL